MTAEHDPLTNVKTVRALDPTKIYAVEVKGTVTRELAEHLKAAFGEHGIRVVVYPSGLIEFAEEAERP